MDSDRADKDPYFERSDPYKRAWNTQHWTKTLLQTACRFYRISPIPTKKDELVAALWKKRHTLTLSRTRLERIKAAWDRQEKVTYDMKDLKPDFVRATSTEKEAELDRANGIDVTLSWMCTLIKHSSSMQAPESDARSKKRPSGGEETKQIEPRSPPSPGMGGDGAGDHDSDSPRAASESVRPAPHSSTSHRDRVKIFHDNCQELIPRLVEAFPLRFTSAGKRCCLCSTDQCVAFCFSCKSAFCGRCNAWLHSKIGSGPVHNQIEYADCLPGQKL
jgi:hypothetical protein